MGNEFVKKADSYIEDNPDILRFCQELNENDSLPNNCKSIALDLEMFDR
jgi:hypothetical protein